MFIVVFIFILLIFSFINISLAMIIMFLAYMDCISVAPLIKIADDLISVLFKDSIAHIKDNIMKSFPVCGYKNFKGQAIYVFHPHGIYSLAHAFHIVGNMTDWPYKNIKATVHSLLMSVPLLKDFHNNKCVPSDYTKMKEVLVNGSSLSVALGGLSETKYIEANKITVCINKRRGIFKMAIETGVPIIPVLTYGENEIYRKMSNSLSTLVDYLFGIHIAIPTLKSLKDWLQIYKAPLENKIRTHIGLPIEVGEARVATESEIVALREKYIAALRKLYKETRSELYAKELEVI